MRLAFVSLVLCSCLVYSTIGDQLPLCGDNCSCIFVDNKESAKVTCTKNVQILVTNPTTWINPDTNSSYQYLEITMTNQNFIELNFTFPANDLTYLNLAGNDIYRIKDSVFMNLQKMKVLILSGNDLELLSPHAFKGLYLPEGYEPLRALRELRLDHNRLHTLNQDIFEHTTDLEILDLSYNPFKVLDPHTVNAIDSLPMLKELYLSYTEITTLPDLILNAPKFLSLLDLSGNPINTVPKTLVNSHNLTTLYFNNTAFVNITVDNGFPDIPTVKVLHLCNLQNLERIEKGSLAGLTGLEELYVKDNIKLTYLDPFALPKTNEKSGGAVWPLLKKLNLANNKLAYLDSDFIARWDSLTELDILDNPWTCECENQWLVEDLTPLYLKIDNGKASHVKCGAPVEMVGFTFVELYDRQYKMRCLDLYGAQPEKDAALLVGVLAGVLIAIPVILFGIYAYQRRWFGIFNMCDNSPAAYSRRFYSTTSSDEYI
ncbi:hypothetical protein ABEB36_006604 [Hypothenemus hampei]|uniref:Uncharacterized protein n=1 Tax=Hypothenemus hampei TaxID=57062 RepID=A0ABD1ER50_HYPHA